MTHEESHLDRHNLPKHRGGFGSGLLKHTFFLAASRIYGVFWGVEVDGISNKKPPAARLESFMEGRQMHFGFGDFRSKMASTLTKMVYSTSPSHAGCSRAEKKVSSGQQFDNNGDESMPEAVDNYNHFDNNMPFDFFGKVLHIFVGNYITYPPGN